MKKLILFTLFCFTIINQVLAQGILETRASYSKNMSWQLSYVYSQSFSEHFGWTSYTEIANSYSLVEIGPQLTLGPATVRGRMGVFLLPTEEGLKIKRQFALVGLVGLKDLFFISINEFSPMKGIEYYYRHVLTYKDIGWHVETVYMDGKYRFSQGPYVTRPLGSGKIVFWFGWINFKNQKIARIGYQINL